MRISVINGNYSRQSRQAFRATLSDSQKVELEKFQHLFDNAQRSDIKRDLLLVKNQNDEIIRKNKDIINQNNAILCALALLANGQYLISSNDDFFKVDLNRDNICDLRDRNIK